MSTPSKGDPRTDPRLTLLSQRVTRVSEMVIVGAAGLLVIAAVVIAAGTLFVLFVRGVWNGLGSIDTIESLQTAVQRLFAGVLLLVLGLEILETLKNYFQDSRIRIEVILIVALIAVSRHVMLIDLEHTPGTVLLGAAALVLALAASYWLVRARPGARAGDPRSGRR